jgi:quercetin dioxygenase-like cupin family protein
MRRAVTRSLILLAMLLFATGGLSVAAQDDPMPGIELAPGVFAEVFSGVPSDRAAGQTLYLARFTFLPDSEIYPHGHPGTTSLSVESGTLGWTLVEGTAYVVRGAATGATEPIEEITEPNVEVLLNPGDAIYYEEDVIHTARGASDEPTVILGTLLLTADEPLLMPAEEMAEMEPAATPAP